MTSRRKLEQLDVCRRGKVETRSYFEDVFLVHSALPEINKDEIELSVNFMGKKLSFPLLIASMTGGHPETLKINKALAKAVEECGIGLGVGSQRAALEDPRQERSFRIVREMAPSAFIYANLGVPQLSYGMDCVERAIEMVDADAIAIHLNFLQEAIQPEGDTNASGCLSLIKEVCRSVKKPVIVKETGAGISGELAVELKKIGVSAIDVGGSGGTSFALVEASRAKGKKLPASSLGLTFSSWGIPTPVSILECKNSGLPIIATGGIRSGLDVAKSIALGASVGSAALPFLKPAIRSSGEVLRRIRTMEEELKIAMFLTGCESIEKLRSVRVILGWRVKEWMS